MMKLGEVSKFSHLDGVDVEEEISRISGLSGQMLAGADSTTLYL